MSRILNDRLGALRRVTSAALLCGIAFSINLWFPISRSLPRAPLLLALPQQVVPAAEYLLSSLLSAAVVALVFAKRPMKYLIVAIVALVVLCLLDQTRLQPWVYQYLAVFVVLALDHRQSRDERSAVLTLLQLIVASLYFWGGLQKLNYSFSHEVLSQLLTPILVLSPSQLSALGVGVATIEIFTGLGLLLKKTRKICIFLALAMHGMILGLLIAQNQNNVVWAWNGALVLMVVVLFWRSDTSIGQVFSYWRAGNTAVRASVIVAALYVVLPVLSFWGWWDLYLSGALYSGNTPVGVVRVAGSVYDRLAPIAKQQVFATSSGERMLPLHEWSMAELNVPPYPEFRVYRQLTREICRSVEDKTHAELIVKTRPAIVDGSYKVVRMDCSTLTASMEKKHL
ncbi:MAG TPA: hypothetical protein VFS76_16480 [Pyrinomonadaceae bacterium]|nr:hypothetical protein [Pyrinomonadaceae bacterium]